MRYLITLFVVCSSFVQADPVLSTLDWRPACEGARIEVISEHQKVLSVQASAFHSSVIAEWTIHYADGIPVSAEYRELSRGRILEGDHMGEYSGENHVKEIHTWRWSDGHFPIKDEARNQELKDILVRAKAQAEQGADGKPQ